MFRKLMGLAAMQQMQNKNSKNNVTFTDVEKDFIWHVKQEFEGKYPKDKFEFKVLEDFTIDFLVEGTLVGEVRLRVNRGINLGDEWFPIEEQEDYFKAKEKVVLWLDFYKRNK